MAGIFLIFVAQILGGHNGAAGGKGGKGGKTNIQFADDSIMAQEKLVSDLTQKWKTASGEMREGYLKDLEEAQKKLDEMTGKVKAKGDGAPTFTMAQLEGISFDNQMPTTRGNSGKAQDKLDLATAAFATGGTSNADFSNYISGIKNALSNANLGDELYTSMTEKLKDATTVSTLLQEMMERGMEGADLESTAQALKEKLLSPEGIDQTAIQSFLEELNKQIEEAGGVGLKLNADTGEVTDDKDKDKEYRHITKNLNFGSIYCMGARSFAQKFKRPLLKAHPDADPDNLFPLADSLMKEYKRKIPFVEPTGRKIITTGERRGYVRTLSGRRQRMPLDGGGYKLVNYLIQGSAADLLKKGLVDAWNAGVFEVLKLHAQVHDEVVFSIPDTKEGYEACVKLKECMMNAYPLRIPLGVDTEIGPDWGHCTMENWEAFEQKWKAA